MWTWTKAVAQLVSRYRVLACITVITLAGTAQAQSGASTSQEIEGLLSFVEHSHCQFVRNGTEYPGPVAREHLEKKLQYLEGRHLVSSTEDFINLAASKSRLSGLPYEVICPEGREPASSWLEKELQRRRELR